MVAKRHRGGDSQAVGRFLRPGLQGLSIGLGAQTIVNSYGRFTHLAVGATLPMLSRRGNPIVFVALHESPIVH
jgi:hypothetical protein